MKKIVFQQEIEKFLTTPQKRGSASWEVCNRSTQENTYQNQVPNPKKSEPSREEGRERLVAVVTPKKIDSKKKTSAYIIKNLVAKKMYEEKCCTETKI